PRSPRADARPRHRRPPACPSASVRTGAGSADAGRFAQLAACSATPNSSVAAVAQPQPRPTSAKGVGPASGNEALGRGHSADGQYVGRWRAMQRSRGRPVWNRLSGPVVAIRGSAECMSIGWLLAPVVGGCSRPPGTRGGGSALATSTSWNSDVRLSLRLWPRLDGPAVPRGIRGPWWRKRHGNSSLTSQDGCFPGSLRNLLSSSPFTGRQARRTPLLLPSRASRA